MTLRLTFYIYIDKLKVYVLCIDLKSINKFKTNKIMNKKEIQEKIDRNKDLITHALSVDDIDMTHYMVTQLVEENEELKAKLKE